MCNNGASGLARRATLSRMRRMTAPLASLLIVEDDPEISRLLADFHAAGGI